MFSAHDLLYLVLAFCAVVITIMVVIVGVQLLDVLRDVKGISRNIEHMTTLVDRVAEIVFPGIERVAKRADSLERGIADFLKKKIDDFGKK